MKVEGRIVANKTAFKPIRTAFGLLLMLLVANALLHITTATETGAHNSPAMLRMTGEMERYRSLERDLRRNTDFVKRDSVGNDLKSAILNIELERMEAALYRLGESKLELQGLTRLVEPFVQISEARRSVQAETDDWEALFASDGPVNRAMQAALFVVRNNMTRLGEELSIQSGALIDSSNRSRQLAIAGGVLAIVVFPPVCLMAGRRASKPLRALKAATVAVAEERWSAVGIDLDTGDALGDFVGAFNTMASQLRESRTERAKAFQGTLASLVQTIEAKDGYTSNHSVNVSKIAGLLGTALDMGQQEINEIIRGALLHDIGKIGVPDGIINKPGALTSDEFSTIQQHPVIGDQIITPLEDAELLSPSVRHHHERWDGTGYPDGLSGEQIPLVARIVAVADVFEALTSDRPYRARMSLEKAITVMREESGKTLDPKLVDMFLSKVVQQLEQMYLDCDEGTSTTESHTDRPPPVACETA